jgi:hypothetical protein
MQKRRRIADVQNNAILLTTSLFRKSLTKIDRNKHEKWQKKSNKSGSFFARKMLPANAFLMTTPREKIIIYNTSKYDHF